MLPDGWTLKDPRDGERPWRVVSTTRGRWEPHGVSIEIQAESLDAVTEAVRLIDAGAAAIPGRGWQFNHNHGFVP